MLTPKQEKFVQNILEGMSQADAYRSAYSAKNMGDNAIYRESSLLMSNPKIAQRLKELRDMLAKPSIMTAQQRLEYLTGIVDETNKERKSFAIDGEVITVEVATDLTTKMKAIDIINKMTGEYVQKIEANVETEVNINIELDDDE